MDKIYKNPNGDTTMSKIYKNPNGDVTISLTKEEHETLTNAMKKAVEELRLVKNGEVMTDTDRQYADEALEGLSVIHDYYSIYNTFTIG